MFWNPDQPYQDLPALPPRADLDSTRILKALVAARSELAALNQALLLMRNPSVLINTIPILEAQSSSEIENIVTTTDELFRYADNDGSIDDASPLKETLRYRTALKIGFDSLQDRPLSTKTAIDICKCIKRTEQGLRNLPGTKIKNPATDTILYTPPVGADVISSKLSNWEHFIHESLDVDPLVRMAVAHYQFEAIHPFFDGNGRTGRILNILILVDLGLLSLPVLYLSRYIIKNKSEYYQLLASVTSSETWEDWVVFMLKAVESTSGWTRQTILDIRDLEESVGHRVKAVLPDMYRKDLVSLVFARPYCRIEDVVNAGLAQRQTASKWLGALARMGVLTEVKAGRTKLFLNQGFYDLLNRRSSIDG